MTYPLITDLAAEGATIRVPVSVSCRVLGVSRQAFYKWRTDPVSQGDWDDANLINAAIDVHADDPQFGYRLISDELAQAGFTASENRVWRVCSLAGVFSVLSPKHQGSKQPGPAVHDDLIERDFTAERPNAVWLTDITEHPTDEGKLYMCAVKDVFSGRIVGYSIDSRMTAALAVTALRSAVDRRGGRDLVTGCVVHSDRGSHFRSQAYLTALAEAGLRGSMGRVASSADNAAMESWFSLLQKNVLNRQRWATREQLRLAIITWTERTYHRRRRQRRLGRLTPIEFETIYQTAPAA